MLCHSPMNLSLVTPGQYFSLSMNQVDRALDGGLFIDGGASRAQDETLRNKAPYYIQYLRLQVAFPRSPNNIPSPSPVQLPLTSHNHPSSTSVQCIQSTSTFLLLLSSGASGPASSIMKDITTCLGVGTMLRTSNPSPGSTICNVYAIP